MIIDAKDLRYRELNEKIREALPEESHIELKNVMGHRYIGCGLKAPLKIDIEGIPGNDMGAFMNGAEIRVNGNVQDAVGNTMNAGKIIVHGDAGDILGHSMRGGRIYVRGNVGYRTGIHIKAFKEQLPVIVIGGMAGDYLGEYMAGGMIVVLGLNREKDREIVGRFIGPGMHGGGLFLNGDVSDRKLSPEVARVEITDKEKEKLREVLKDYAKEMSLDNLIPDKIIPKLVKLIPITTRPYGKLYAY